jgi:DNA polymerase-3 subunit delta'
VSVWDAVAGQEPAVATLERDLASGRVAHAYLFSGSAGSAPLQCALALAAAVNCETAGCGTCESCRRILHAAHPDVEVIEPAGMQLLVEQVRDAIRAAWRMPVAGRRRVIVVDQADRMNPNAQNAFLKALEEPPASTVVVLVASSADTLLDTVRSRCREVGFRPPPEARVVSLLTAEGVAEADARRWARVGGGLERARLLASDAGARDRRREIVERVLEPLTTPGEALERAEWLAASARSARDAVAAAHKAKAEELADWTRETKRSADDRLRREQRRAEQDALEGALDDVASVLRDLAALVGDSQTHVLGADVEEALRARAAGLGPHALARVAACMDAVARARRNLRVNANVLVTLEHVFLALWRNLGVVGEEGRAAAARGR